MAQIDEVYSYLQENYSQNEPIFLSELIIPGIKPVSLRQQLKKLTEDGLNALIPESIIFRRNPCSVLAL